MKTRTRVDSSAPTASVIKWTWLALTATVIAGAWLRLHKLGEWSFWLDEMWTIGAAFGKGFDIWKPYNLPPLDVSRLGSVAPFVLMAKLGIHLSGVSEISLRLGPALIGIVSIPLLYLLIRRILGNKLALSTALLLAFSTWHIYMSQNARYFASLSLTYFASLIFACLYLTGSSRTSYVCYILGLWLAIHDRSHALFIIPVLVGYAILVYLFPSDERSIAPGRVGLLVGSALFLYASRGWLSPQNQGPIGELEVIASSQFLGSPVFLKPHWIVTLTANNVGVPLCVAGIAASLRGFFCRDRFILLMTCAAVVPVLLVSAISPFAFIQGHYTLMTLPPWLVLAAVGVRDSWREARLGRPQPILLLFAIAIFSYLDRSNMDLLYYFFNQDHSSQLLVPVILSIASGLFLVAWLTARATHQHALAERGHALTNANHRPAHISAVHVSTAAWGLVVFVLIAHVQARNVMYFYCQHGHRDNYAAAAAAIRKSWSESDAIVAGVAPVVAYYTQRQVRDILDCDLSGISQEPHRTWFVHDYGLEKAVDTRFPEWLDAECQLVSDNSRYVNGRLWPLRVYVFDPERAPAYSKE